MSSQEDRSAYDSQSLQALISGAQQGHIHAQYELGYGYQLGLYGGKSDYRTAADWYHKAATSGHALAQYRLGVLLARGWVGIANPEAASRWCYQAVAQKDSGLLVVLHAEAAAGDGDAQHTLGSVYNDGAGVDRDDCRAFELWLSAAGGYCPRASFNVARAYEFGIGTEADIQKAAHWYGNAARRGVGRAAHRLAQLLIEGQAIPANLDKAKMYLKMAVATGWPQARADLIAIQRLVLDSDRSDKERHNE